MPTQPQKRKINPLAIIAIILILLALGILFLIFAPGPRMKWALTMGEKYLTDCEYTQAVTMFSRAIRVDDRSEPAYWGRAQAYVQLGDSAAATSDLTYIIDELGTENADVYLTRANLYMDMGDTDAAQADLTAAASLGADTTEAEARLTETATTDEAGNTPDAETPATTRFVSLPVQRTSYSTIVSSLEPTDTTITTTETMQFDDEGRLKSYNSSSGQTVQMDDHGEVIVDDEAPGYRRQMTNTYDEEGRLVTQDITGSTGQYQDHYTYDDHGNMTNYATGGEAFAESDYIGSITCTYDYDDQGRITQSTRSDYGTTSVSDYTYTADSYTVVTTDAVSGIRLVNTYTLDGVPISNQQYYHTQSGAEFLSSETTYNVDGNVLTVRGYDRNGTMYSTTDNTYDEKGRIMQSREVSYYGQGSEKVTSYAYTYNADGNVIGRTATTDGKVTEETTYTVQEVPGDYDIYYADVSDIRYPYVYLYGQYIVLN